MNTKASLTDSLKRLARGVEESLSAHPEPETLLAYRDDELSPGQSAAVQEHLNWCRECTAILDDLTWFSAGDESLEGEVPKADPQEKAADWAELMDRIDGAKVGDGREAAAAAHTLWPRSAQLVAAVLVLAVGFSVLWIGRLQGRLEQTLDPQPNVPIYDLDPAATERVGEEAPGIALAPGARAVLILNPVGAVPPGRYEVRFLTPEGGTVWSSEELEPTRFGNFNLELVGSSLPPGRYRIEVSGPRPGSEQVVGSFVFRVLQSP